VYLPAVFSQRFFLFLVVFRRSFTSFGVVFLFYTPLQFLYDMIRSLLLALCPARPVVSVCEHGLRELGLRVLGRLVYVNRGAAVRVRHRRGSRAGLHVRLFKSCLWGSDPASVSGTDSVDSVASDTVAHCSFGCLTFAPGPTNMMTSSICLHLWI
jgi:hypothetical protein